MPTQFSPSLLLDDTLPETDYMTTNYAPSGIRRFAFAIVFLLLLPFFASLPAMIFQRVVAGVWLDTWGLLVIALAFTILMALILFELIYALRAEIEIGDRRLRMTLPNGRPHAMPMLAYTTHEIAYADIASVERVREVYGGTLAPVMMVSHWIVLDDHRRVLLGAVNEKCTDHIFPFEAIAKQVAERAGVAVVDVGIKKRQIKDRLLGLKASEADGTPLAEATLVEVNKQHRGVSFALISVFAFLLILGLVTDTMNRSLDLGERQPSTTLPFL
ncbi:MAG: hypothetical protein AAFR23_01690 [Pseudomonadota bacterium]